MFTTPLSAGGLGGGGGVVNPTTKFSNRGLVDRTSSFKDFKDFKEVTKNPNYWGCCVKRGLEQLADLRGGLVKKWRGCFRGAVGSSMCAME